MRRTLTTTSLATILTLILGADALAQRPVQWISSPQRGVAQARKTFRPVLFYVPGDDGGGDNDMEDAQRIALRDSVVREIIESRFVPVRLNRSNAAKQILQEIGAPTNYGNYLAVVSPNGKLIRQIPPRDVAGVDPLKRTLTNVFRQYRNEFYKEQIQAVLKAEKLDKSKILVALDQIQEFIITDADADVAALFEHEKLNPRIEREICDTLAVLSTPKAVEALVDQLGKVRYAEKALEKCTTGAAQHLLGMLKTKEGAVRPDVYQAIVEICNIDDGKPSRYWQSAPKDRQQEEIQRITEIAQKKATRWNQTIGELR